ncbi:MAG: hypothetical protein ACKO23_09380 [Gemmataceae bacterium]
MTPNQAVARVETVLAHAWMVRTFLKHADEIAELEDFLEVHRTIFDVVRAVEPARQRNDTKEFLHRIKGKLPRLRRAAVFFAENFRQVTDHTNWQMAAASLSGCVSQLEEILAQLPRQASSEGGPSPSASIDPAG